MIDFAILGIGLFLTYLNIFPFNNGNNTDMIFPEESLIQQFPDKRIIIRKKNALETNHQKSLKGFPIFYGNQKYTVYTSDIVEDDLLGEVSLACAFPYLCVNTQEIIFLESGEVSQIDLHLRSVFRSVKSYKYLYYGKRIPEVQKILSND
jgi:hypothetical protein